MNREYKLPFAACLLAVAVWMTACDKGGETDTDISTPDNDYRTHLSINAMKPGFASEDADTRATTDENHATSFENGDAIGLFAVRGGTVQTDCNNLKLVYDASAGTWKNPDSKNVFYFEGSDYYAYSPYDAAMNGKTSVAEITGSWTIPANQSTAALFAKADLMVSQSCTADKTAKTLDITFTHAFSMLKIAARAHAVTTDGTFRYPLKTTVARTIYINGTERRSYCLAFDAETYRYIVRPTTLGIPIDITYEYNNSTTNYIKYEGGNTGSLSAGQFKKYTPLKTRQPEVGDYFYADGSIYPRKWLSPPDKDNGCVGVIFSMTPNQYDTDRGAHGYVVALDFITYTEPNASIPNVGFAWMDPELAEPYMPSYSSWADAVNAYAGNISCGHFDISYYPAFQKVAEYQDQVPLPNGYTWYLPTVYQLIQIFNNLGGAKLSATVSEDNDRDYYNSFSMYLRKVKGKTSFDGSIQIVFWTCQKATTQNVYAIRTRCSTAYSPFLMQVTLHEKYGYMYNSSVGIKELGQCICIFVF